MSNSSLDSKALIRAITLAAAKEIVQEKINCWTSIGEGYTFSQKDANAEIITTAHIQSYLLECKKKLTVADFQELIHFAIKLVEQSDIRPAPNAPRQYHQQYHQLKEMLEKQLTPNPWSDFITAEIVSASFFLFTLIALASMAPVVAAVASNGTPSTHDKNSDSTLTVLKLDDLKMTQATGELAFENIQDNIENMAEAQNSLISFQERNRHYAILLANKLIAFSQPNATPEDENYVIYQLLENKNSIPKLRLILNHASNKLLLYKIVAKLSHLLNKKVSGEGLSNVEFTLDLATDGHPKNSNYLIFFLGESILKMQKSDLAEISKDKLSSMNVMLRLFQSFRTQEGKIVVQQQIENIRSIIHPKIDALRSIAVLNIDYEKTIAIMEREETETRGMMRYSGIPYYGTILATQLRQLHIREKIDHIANNLADFYKGSLAAQAEMNLLTRLLHHSDLMQPLSIILRDALNKSLLHKIVAKLAEAFYMNLKETKPPNATSLIILLGSAIMQIQPDDLSEISTSA